jgi:hypothetical protein
MTWPIVLAFSLWIQAGASLDVPDNLLIDPHADLGDSAWRTVGEANIEYRDGNPSFVVRNRGMFQQTASIRYACEPRYAVFLARAASERINADGSITGLPHLYGMMLSGERGRILAHLQGQGMLSRSRTRDEWSTLWGVFRVPEGTVSILFELGLAERRGDPHNGSAGRFDDAALVLLPTLDDANALVRKYQMGVERLQVKE